MAVAGKLVHVVVGDGAATSRPVDDVGRRGDIAAQYLHHDPQDAVGAAPGRIGGYQLDRLVLGERKCVWAVALVVTRIPLLAPSLTMVPKRSISNCGHAHGVPVALGLNHNLAAQNWARVERHNVDATILRRSCQSCL